MQESEDIIKVAWIVNIMFSPSFRFSPRENEYMKENLWVDEKVQRNFLISKRDSKHSCEAAT